MSNWQYLVIMKSLPSEYRALRTIAAATRAGITPLIQLWDRAPSAAVGEGADDTDVDLDNGPGFFDQQTIWTNGSAERVWHRLIGGLFPKTLENWPRERRVLLDGEWLDESGSMRSVLANARVFGMDVVPVTGLDRAPDYQAVVAEMASPERGGLVLRLRGPDFRRAIPVFRERIHDVLTTLGASIATTDVVLDLGAIDPGFREGAELNVESMVRFLPSAEQWRNVAVVASGSPEQVSAKRFATDDLTPYARPEWWLWQELRSRAQVVTRVPVYGDYGTIHPGRIEPLGEPKSLPRIPQIRYASGDRMLMLRGHDLRGEGDGTRQIADMLDRAKEFGAWAGSQHCAGCERLQGAATGTDSPGDWGTWKWISQVHLLTHTSAQLANPNDF